MKVQNKTIKSSILKKLFIKICRMFDFEIIDQGNLHLPVIDRKSPKILSKIGDQSLVLPMGKVKITRKVKSLDILLRTCASVNMLSQSKKRIFKSALGLSGIYDLRPLINVQSVNADLKLDKNLASLVSPALITPPKTAGLTISVGGQETEGFKEQHSIIAEKWQGSILNDIPSPEDNHFSILDSFVDPSSDLHNYWINILNGNH